MPRHFLHERKALKMKKLLLFASLAATACSPASDSKTEVPTEKDSPSIVAFKAANNQMHKDMGFAFTGNADVDFMRSMIPHHEGAVAMAKVALEHGKDPEVRKLAKDVIAAQEAEIAQMKAWLAKNNDGATAVTAEDHQNH